MFLADRPQGYMGQAAKPGAAVAAPVRTQQAPWSREEMPCTYVHPLRRTSNVERRMSFSIAELRAAISRKAAHWMRSKGEFNSRDSQKCTSSGKAGLSCDSRAPY